MGVLLLQISFVITVYGIAVAYEVSIIIKVLCRLPGTCFLPVLTGNNGVWSSSVTSGSGVSFISSLHASLALLKDLRALAKPSQMGNFFIITVSIIVIMCEQSSQLIHSYGICSFGLHIDTKNLMWSTPLVWLSFSESSAIHSESPWSDPPPTY